MSFSDENTVTADLWHKREFADVVISVAGREFPAHKMVLATQSEYFRGLLYGNMKEALMSKISLPEDILPPDTFEKVLKYFYIKTLNIDEPIEVCIMYITHECIYIIFTCYRISSTYSEQLISFNLML